jgi:cytosine/creatinine deaminase
VSRDPSLTWFCNARISGRKSLVDVGCDQHRIVAVEPHLASRVGRNLNGALVLGGLAAWHTHLDKTFTIERAQQTEPGLLGAIAACVNDHKTWTSEDLFERGNRALQQAWDAGCTVVRTHIDWVVEAQPIAWSVFEELAKSWQGRIELQRVALLRSEFFETPLGAQNIVAAIRLSGGWLGAFIHSSNASQIRMDNLVRNLLDSDLKLDLHLDEEINPNARGLEFLLDSLNRFNAMQNHPHISASHVCALSAMPDQKTAKLIDGLALAQLEVVALPATNLYLQDQSNPLLPSTPKHRGIAPVHELRRAGVKVRLACDNVQDPFYPWGNYDPFSLMELAAPALQLVNCFDEWADTIAAHPVAINQPANLTIVEGSTAAAWPAAIEKRILFRANDQ